MTYLCNLGSLQTRHVKREYVGWFGPFGPPFALPETVAAAAPHAPVGRSQEMHVVKAVWVPGAKPAPR